MKANIPYFLDFPKDFCQEAIEAVDRAVKRGVNLQLVGREGSGKSLIFRSMAAKRDNFFIVDSNLLTDRVIDDLVKKLEEYKTNHQTGVMLIDSFENVVGVKGTNTAEKIMSVYNHYRNFVTFVFSVEKEISMKSSYDIFYVKPLKLNEARWFITGLMRENDEMKIDEAMTIKIFEASGGIMGLMKRLFELVVAGNEIDEVVEHPGRFARMAYQLEMMIDELILDRGVDIEVMKKYGLVDDKGKYLSVIVENYVKLKTEKENVNLTTEEYKMSMILETNRGMVVDREKLIEGVWGKHATREISDHALDQLAHRLREKVKNKGMEIVTVRGRGYVMR